jgi:hypothetical protein
MNRYYGWQHGRFLTPDPYQASAGLTDPGSWNRYVYVLGDPVNWMDPTGLDACAAEVGMPCFSTTVTAPAPGWWSGGWFGGGGDGRFDRPEVYAEVPAFWPGEVSGGAAPPSPRDILLERRAQVYQAIYQTEDYVFGPEVLDCMAGRESDWNPSAVNGRFRGMFQMSADAWADVYRDVPNAPSYMENVFDPARAAAAAATYLHIRLRWLVGEEKYGQGRYTESDLRAAIKAYNGSSIAESYAKQIWDCAQKLKAGDLEGALRAIGKP